MQREVQREFRCILQDTVKKQVSRFRSTDFCLKVEQLMLGCSNLKYAEKKKILEFPYNYSVFYIFLLNAYMASL